jgi:hypothetical protein
MLSGPEDASELKFDKFRDARERCDVSKLVCDHSWVQYDTVTKHAMRLASAAKTKITVKGRISVQDLFATSKYMCFFHKHSDSDHGVILPELRQMKSDFAELDSLVAQNIFNHTV